MILLQVEVYSNDRESKGHELNHLADNSAGDLKVVDDLQLGDIKVTLNHLAWVLPLK